MQEQNMREDMNIVIVGHVDHGKSTVAGRLLLDTDSLPAGKLAQVEELCRRTSKPLEYAYLLDALKDEQAQGITIDSARCFFKTAKRNYILIDAPGHTEFLKNMVTGAARADAALLVIDAAEGIRDNTKRHGYLLSMLGVKQVSVLVNKMDLIDFNEEVYREIVREFRSFLQEIQIVPSSWIPVSGRMGDNLVKLSEQMSWYKGMTALEALEAFTASKLPEDKPFRMPVQSVYKFTGGGDTRRIIAGTVESGRLQAGDDVIFYPSLKRSKVKSIEAFHEPKKESVSAGLATGFTIEDDIYLKRGEMAARADEVPPQTGTAVHANIFWLGSEPMRQNQTYDLKLGTAKVGARLTEIKRTIDSVALKVDKKTQINQYDVAECIVELEKEVAFDYAYELAQTGRFVIVDKYEIAGGGIILGTAQTGSPGCLFRRLLKKVFGK